MNFISADAFNRRVAKKVNGLVTKRWLYKDQLAPIAELDASGNVVYYFIYGTKRNIPDYAVHVPTSAQYRLVTDQLGSLKMVVNTTDATISRYVEYDEFGRVLSDSNPDLMPFGFAGGMYDNQTKLTRFGARDYDAETGRWTNKDPIRFQGGDSNLYGYVLQDPVNLKDPNGKDPFSDFVDSELAINDYLSSTGSQAVEAITAAYVLTPAAVTAAGTALAVGGPQAFTACLMNPAACAEVGAAVASGIAQGLSGANLPPDPNQRLLGFIIEQGLNEYLRSTCER